jgi:Domain of unknown function (DUF4411)
LLYLLDANVLIRADEDYYGFEQVPQFWDWLFEQCQAGAIKMPLEIWQEVAGSHTKLGEWINDTAVKEVLILEEEADPDMLNEVLTTGYGADLTDTELEKIGQDMFLVAYARVDAERVVVTKEVSAPAKLRANRKLPDVCNTFGVKWTKDFDLYRNLGFKAK